MEIKTTGKFLKSYRVYINGTRWYYKIWDFFRYEIIRFFQNVFRFRKELSDFRRFDHAYNIAILRRSLELTADYIEKHGHEIEKSRMKKIVKMRRAIEIMKIEEASDYISLAEKELGIEVDIKKAMVLEPTNDGSNTSELKDYSSAEVKKSNTKIFKRSNELEIELWEELCGILKGQDEYTGDSKDYEKWYDGSGMKGWWD